MVKPAYSQFGGKYKLLQKIIPLIPQMDTYVEPFGGGGSVLMNLPEGMFRERIINDIDPVYSTLLKGFQKYDGETISEIINGSYTRDDFIRLKESNPKSFKDKFFTYLLLKKLSILGHMKYIDNTRSTLNTKYTNVYKDALKGVKIYNKDYKFLISKYDSPNTFFYLDPPYMGSSKSHYNFPAFDIKELLEIMSKIKGKFLISYNYDKDIETLAKQYGYKVNIIDTKYTSRVVSKSKAQDKQELLIRNY